MKDLFVILDTSGSIALAGNHKIGQINDLLRDLISVTNGKYERAYIITYSDMPRIYWKSASGEIFMDIPAGEFGGRSGLGAAYEFVGKIISSDSSSAARACLVLISDGSATDNYKKALKKLDPKGESARVAGLLGSSGAVTYTLDYHVGDAKNVYPDVSGYVVRDEFFDEIVTKLEK